MFHCYLFHVTTMFPTPHHEEHPGDCMSTWRHMPHPTTLPLKAVAARRLDQWSSG